MAGIQERNLDYMANDTRTDEERMREEDIALVTVINTADRKNASVEDVLLVIDKLGLNDALVRVREDARI